MWINKYMESSLTVIHHWSLTRLRSIYHILFNNDQPVPQLTCFLFTLLQLSFCLTCCHLEHMLSHVGSDILTMVVVKSSTFWDITPWSLLEVNEGLGGTCGLHLHCQRRYEEVCAKMVSKNFTHSALQHGGGDQSWSWNILFLMYYIPCDIFIFLTMRTQFKGLHFEVMDMIQNVTTDILNHLHENDFWKCFRSWK